MSCSTIIFSDQQAFQLKLVEHTIQPRSNEQAFHSNLAEQVIQPKLIEQKSQLYQSIIKVVKYQAELFSS